MLDEDTQHCKQQYRFNL